MEGLKEAIAKILPVTRYYLGGTLLMSFCMTYRIISPYVLFLDFPSVFYQGQIWRLVTTFFFAGGFSMNFLFAMMMIYYTFN
jgi:Derlin-2/3